jgi:hypothetical protein
VKEFAVCTTYRLLNDVAERFDTVRTRGVHNARQGLRRVVCFVIKASKVAAFTCLQDELLFQIRR